MPAWHHRGQLTVEALYSTCTMALTFNLSCQLGTTGVVFGVAFVVRAVHFLVDKFDFLFTNSQTSVPGCVYYVKPLRVELTFRGVFTV